MGANRIKLLLPVVILIVGFGLRIYALDDFNMNWDEGYSNWIVHLPFGEMIETTARDVHPPFYYLLLRFNNIINGDGEFVMRFPSVLLGMLGMALTFALGKQVGGYWVGVLALLLLGMIRANIDIAQLMRMHVLAMVFSTAGMWSALRFWQNPNRRGAALIYVLCAAGSLYSFYLAVVFPLAANMAFLIIWLWRLGEQHTFNRVLFMRWVGLQIAAVALFLPWVLYAITRMHGWSAEQDTSFIFFLQVYFVVLTTGVSTFWDSFIPWVIAALALLGAGTVLIYQSGRRLKNNHQINNLTMLLASVFSPVLVVFLLTLPFHNLGRPLAARYLVLLAPGFYVLGAWTVIILAKRHLVFAIAALILLVGLAAAGLAQTHKGQVRRDLYTALSKTLTAHRQPGDSVVLHDDWAWPLFENNYDGAWVKVPNESVLDEAFANLILEPVWAESDAVWVVQHPGSLVSDPNHQIENWLSRHAIHQETWEYNENLLSVYVRVPERVDTLNDLAGAIPPKQIDGATSLIAIEPPLRRYPVGDDVHFALYWEIAPSESVKIELVSDSDEQTFEFDVPQVTQGVIRQAISVPLPPDLPAGTYRLQLMQDSPIELAKLEVVNLMGDVYADEAAVTNRLDWQLGEQVELLGYDINSTSFHAGDEITVTLYWRTNSVLKDRYKVLVYTLGDWNVMTDNPLWGQQDSEPLNWNLPTTYWQPNTIIRDTYRFEIMDYTPPGEYQIGVVMYNLLDGVRLLIADTDGNPLGDTSILTPVMVR